jgi:hypothetical protein
VPASTLEHIVKGEVPEAVVYNTALVHKMKGGITFGERREARS